MKSISSFTYEEWQKQLSDGLSHQLKKEIKPSEVKIDIYIEGDETPKKFERIVITIGD